MALVRILGFLLSRLPEGAIRCLAIGLADFFLLISPSRKRIAWSNLRHAYPEKDLRWIRATGRESVRQTIEFGMLALATPFMNEKRLRKIFSVSESAESIIQKHKSTGRPAVLVGPHLGPQEGHALLPLFFPDLPVFGAIYRPLDNPKLDAWIRKTRERYGIQLFSRKRSLQSGIRLLQAKSWLGIFFDQNARSHGALITFFNRVASVTDLPGILASRYGADIFMLYTARTAFWRIEFRGDELLAETKDREHLTIAINRWLEELLKSDETLIPNWLWLHNRWRHQSVPRFSLRTKRNLLDTQNKLLGRRKTPRTEPFFVQLPETLGETVFLLPLLRALRKARPDVAITAIGKSDLVSLVSQFGLCEKAIPFPSGFGRQIQIIRQLRNQFPTAHFVFQNGAQHDFPVRLIGAPHRFGIALPGERRRHLNRIWNLPEELAKPDVHLFDQWKAFFRSRDLKDKIDRAPFHLPSAKTEKTVALFHDQDWPIDRWQDLIEHFLKKDAPVRMFAAESIAKELKSRFPGKSVRFLAVPSSPDLARMLADCCVAIGTLSGEIHLANAVGIPVVCLAPPNRPDLPVFEGEVHLIREPLKELSSEAVLGSPFLSESTAAGRWSPRLKGSVDAF